MESNASDNKDVQLVTGIAKLLCQHPDDVEVARTIDDLGVLITLRVNAEDMASIIGREGRAAKSIRTLLRVIGAQNNERVNLKIVEPYGAEGASDTEAAPAREKSDEPVEAPVAAPVAPVEPAPAETSAWNMPSSDDDSTPTINLDDIPEPLV